MEKTKTTIKEYVDSLPESSQADIRTLDKEISKIFPEKVMWEGVFWGGSKQRIIGYDNMIFKRPKKEDIEWFYVGLALQKNYITIYVTAIDSGQYLAEKNKGKLGKAKVGKSTITFKSLADVDLEELINLLKKAKELKPKF